MFGKTIKYYRIQKNYSQQQLADAVGVQKMTISNYENEKREPDINTIKKICKALDVSLSRFMAYKPLRKTEIILNGSFKKSDKLSSTQEQKIIGQIQYAVERYLIIGDILGTGTIDASQIWNKLSYMDNQDKNAGEMRKLVGLSVRGAIGNLVQCLENSNVFFVPIDVEDSAFSGYSCWFGKLPIIAYNNRMTLEKQRFTIAHELVHLLFENESKLSEKEVDDIAGRFLLPAEDCKRELGAKRKNITSSDLQFIHDEYGVSARCVALRAKQTDIINNDVYRKAAKYSFKSEEGLEIPTRFIQLMCRAYNEKEINLNRVSELMDISYAEAETLFC